MDAQWSAAQAPDGRTYYYNNVTKVTQWTKPEALMTPAERALAQQPWVEHTTPEGKKYWYNKETRVSTWEIPEVYKNALAQSSIPQKPTVPAQTYVAGGTPNFVQHQPQREREDFHHGDRGDRGDRYDRDRERPNAYGQSDGVRSSFVPAATAEPEYATFEEAEAAFFKCLKRYDVEPDWTFQQVVAACVKDPQYRAIKDPKDRQLAIEKFQNEQLLQDKERLKERAVKLRHDFRTMLMSHPEITHISRWKTIRPIIEGETIYRNSNDEAEKHQLFLEYRNELRENHEKQEMVTRQAAQEDIVNLFRDLVTDPYMKWADALEKLSSNERFHNDPKFRTLNKLHLMNAFSDHIRSIERIAVEERQKQKSSKFRRERTNRDNFRTLLAELRSKGLIKAGTMWKDLYPHLKDDPRYDAILGQPGSTVLDMFWDIVEEEDQILRRQRREVLDVLDDKRFAMTPQTSLEDFMDIVTTDRRTSGMGHDNLGLIFNQLHAKVIKREEEDKHQQERAQRRAADALRSVIKHLDPPVRIDDSWERDVRPRVENTDEYRAVEDEDSRRHAFDKVIRRLKDKEAEAAEHEKSRHGERNERDTRRGDRRDGRGRAKHSRTPEPDAYEADRKRAVAEREGRYRKTPNTGLSPTPAESRSRHGRDRGDERDRHDERDRDREKERFHERDGFTPRSRDRERFDERGGRLGAGYERERRDPREIEREVVGRERPPYVSRADPRDVGAAKELDYGESGRAGSMSGSVSVGPGAGVSRRRRASGDGEIEDGEVSVGRESKRARKERSVVINGHGNGKGGSGSGSGKEGEMSKAEVEEQEEIALKSGSEEGEIEEVEAAVGDE